MNNPKRGFIALISSVVISFALLALVLSLNASSLSFSKEQIERFNKRQSRLVALSCLRLAVLKIIQDPFYTPSGNVEPVGDKGVCKINSITGGSEKQVVVQGDYRSVVTYMEAKVNVHREPVQIDTIVELEKF